jgi:predicted PurR-regulated permease PerM
MDMDKKVMLVHIAVGLIAGYLSYIISNTTYALVMAFAIMYALKFVTNVMSKEKKKFGWWFGAGGAVYLFLWFISWIIFLNLLPA